MMLMTFDTLKPAYFNIPYPNIVSLLDFFILQLVNNFSVMLEGVFLG